MKKEDIVKQLLPGVIVGFILGFCLTMLVGVDTKNAIPNYIGGALCCGLPTLLNGLIVLKGTAKHLDRELSIKKAFFRILPLVFCALLFGFLFVVVFVEQIIGISTCDITVVNTAIYEALLGVIVSTLTAYIALKKYESDVKYTRRNK